MILSVLQNYQGQIKSILMLKRLLILKAIVMSINIIKRQAGELKDMISNKNAQAVLNTSTDIDETILWQLQDERLDKIQDIERSMRVDDPETYLNSASKLSSLKYHDNPYQDMSTMRSKNKMLGHRSDFVKNNDRFSHSFDNKRNSSISSLNLNPRVISKGRHQDDPFISNLA